MSTARLKHFGWGREGEGLTAEEEAFVMARAQARFGTALEESASAPRLEEIVMKALEKDPGSRYQSARDMQADLEAFIREERIAVSAVSLANWMRMLFEDKIAEQKEALQDVKQLADVIARTGGLRRAQRF